MEMMWVPSHKKALVLGLLLCSKKGIDRGNKTRVEGEWICPWLVSNDWQKVGTHTRYVCDIIDVWIQLSFRTLGLILTHISPLLAVLTATPPAADSCMQNTGPVCKQPHGKAITDSDTINDMKLHPHRNLKTTGWLMVGEAWWRRRHQWRCQQRFRFTFFNVFSRLGIPRPEFQPYYFIWKNTTA